MKKNAQYNGLNNYSKKSNIILNSKIVILAIFTIIILYIVNVSLKKSSLKENIALNEINIIESNDEENEIEETLDTSEEVMISNTYIDDDKMVFIEKISNGAINNYNKYGVLPSITMAQAILESGWGNSELAVTHNNLFGIKADSRWNGAVATIRTSENYNDYTVASFRKYDNINESLDDHGKFLSENSRYAEYGLFKGEDYKAQAQALEDAGYSTVKNENGTPIYADKLISVIEKYNLMQYD